MISKDNGLWCPRVLAVSLSITVFVLLAIISASATIVIPPPATASLTAGSTTVASFGSLSVGNSTASASLIGPMVSGAAGFGGVSLASMDYYFIVIGDGGQIPIVISGAYQLTSSGQGGGDVAVSLSADPTRKNPPQFEASCNGTCTMQGPYTINNQTVSGGVPYDLFMNAAGGSARGAGSYSGWLDPTITIDPTYLRLHPGDSIIFSPGVNAAPEPSSLLLLGAGIAGVLVRTRKRLLG